MKKSATKTKRNQAPNASEQRTLRLAAFVKQNLYRFIIDEGVLATSRIRVLRPPPGSHDAAHQGPEVT